MSTEGHRSQGWNTPTIPVDTFVYVEHEPGEREGVVKVVVWLTPHARDSVGRTRHTLGYVECGVFTIYTRVDADIVAALGLSKARTAAELRLLMSCLAGHSLSYEECLATLLVYSDPGYLHDLAALCATKARP